MVWRREREDFWRNGREFLRIECYEDCEQHKPEECTCMEVWMGDDETGSNDCLGIFDNITKAMNEALKFMHDNPNGWMEKDKPIPIFIFR